MNYPLNETGKRIQNYVFNYSDFLGAGNFSKCYKGYNEITKEIVAIKIIELNSLKSKKLQQLLFQQIEILKKLNHPSVLKCYQIFTSNRNCYIITELCNQGNLENHLKFKKTFDQHQANPIIKDVYEGLLYLSQNNIVHRDLKSANIFLHNGRAKIADFGFAKQINHNFKDLNIGSPLYMAPQGILHNVYGPKTQVWALGILVYQLFHGSSPYINCKTQQQLKRNVMIPLNWNQLRSDLPQDIKQFILTCLEINQQKRATIQQLMNLGYVRRLKQLDGQNLFNGFEVRSSSKSVHLINTQENLKRFQPQSQQRINNNFRQQGVVLMRQPSRRRTNQRPLGFKSVDMRSNQRQNTYDFQSPRRPPILGNPNRVQFHSPSKRTTMINSLRPPSSHNQNFLSQNPQMINLISPTGIAQSFERPNVFQTVQNPMIPQNQFIHQTNGIFNPSYQNDTQNQNYPISHYESHSKKKSNFDSIGYNSMNGFYNPSIQGQTNDNFVNFQAQQLDLLPPPQPQKIDPIQVEKEGNNASYIFKSKISFKEAIFFIHHCRLIFKFLYLYKETVYFDQEKYLRIFKHMMSLLTQLNKLADSNGITADGQKSALKIKKFREVNIEYLAKYTKQLQDNNYSIVPQTITKQNLSGTNSVLREVFNRLNDEISSIKRKSFLSSTQENLIILGHLCITIIGSLKQIQSCIEKGNFKKLLQFKEIQTVLNTPKEDFTTSSYNNYFEKFIT